MTVEEIPDDCLPPTHVIEEVLRGPELDSAGRIKGGVWHGMTPEDIIAARDEYNRLVGE